MIGYFSKINSEIFFSFFFKTLSMDFSFFVIVFTDCSSCQVVLMKIYVLVCVRDSGKRETSWG
jgi:hypothetical protein